MSRARATIWAFAAAGGRCHDRGHAARTRAPRLRRRRPRARSFADFGMLRRSAVLSSRAMGGALDVHRASGTDVAVRLPARRPGGINPSGRCNDPWRCGHRRDAAGVEPAPSPSTRCSAIMRGGAPTRSRSSMRRTGRSSPMARRDRLSYAEADRIGHGHRRAAAPHGAADRRRHRHPVAEHRREAFSTMLGVLRAGMIAAPLPLLGAAPKPSPRWRASAPRR